MGKRVLLLDVNCKSGSTGKLIYDLYTQLNELGHIAAIGYGRGSLVKEPNIIKFSSDYEVSVHALLTRITGLTGYFSYFATKRLIRFMEEFKPEVVHLNDMHGYYVNILTLMKYLKEKNIKTIWTFHCEYMYTGKCGHSYQCEKWKSECGECPNLKDYPKSIFFDFTNKMFQDKKNIFRGFNNLIVVTPSEWLAGRVKQSFLKDKRIITIPNGIDIENVFHPRSYEHLKRIHKLTNEKIILAAAPDLMSDQKGGKYVLELAKKMKNEKVKIILIGVKDIDSIFDDNIIAFGRIDNQIELAQYYSMADVFVICSKRENFPTTCIEAISCGTPVCGFDEGGTKETAPGKLGIFVPYGDVEGLMNAVHKMFENADEEQSALCAQYGRDNYSKSLMFRRYNELY